MENQAQSGQRTTSETLMRKLGIHITEQGILQEEEEKEGKKKSISKNDL